MNIFTSNQNSTTGRGHLTNLDAAILTVIQQQGRIHGLAIAVQAEFLTKRILGPGTLYRILRRAEKAGYVRSEWEDRSKEPRHTGPRRRYYEIQDAGRAQLELFGHEYAEFAQALGIGLEPAT